MNNISDRDLQKLSLSIRDRVFTPAYSFKTTVFLCGASLTEKTKLRYQIEQSLTKSFRYSYRYDIIHPEDIFDELLYDPKENLLSLEEILAESIDAIVLIPESPGSFAELGAFANNAKLREKLICVSDSKYKRIKSFINGGPIKLVKQTNKKNIIYINGDKDFSEEIEKLSAPLSRLKAKSNKEKTKLNLLQLENYLLPAIYLLGPIDRNNLTKLVFYALEDKKFYQQATITALNIMTQKKIVNSTSDGYTLTKNGLSNYHNFQKTKKRISTYSNIMALDKLRLEIMNLQYRNKKIAI